MAARDERIVVGAVHAHYAQPARLAVPWRRRWTPLPTSRYCHPPRPSRSAAAPAQLNEAVLKGEPCADPPALIASLPTREADLVSWVLDVMADVHKHEDVNRMGATALAVVFTPGLLKPEGLAPDKAMQYAVQAPDYVSKLLVSYVATRAPKPARSGTTLWGKAADATARVRRLTHLGGPSLLTHQRASSNARQTMAEKTTKGNSGFNLISLFRSTTAVQPTEDPTSVEDMGAHLRGSNYL